MGYEIYMPVLGTGKSRARLQPKEALQLIKETFVAHAEKINGQIHIVALDTMIAELN